MHESIDTRSPKQIRADEEKARIEAEEAEYWAAVKRIDKRAYTCPDGHVHPEGNSIPKSIADCYWVIGRRGWRKLGDYDG